MTLKSPWISLVFLGLFTIGCRTESPPPPPDPEPKDTQSPILVNGKLRDWLGRPQQIKQPRVGSSLRSLWATNNDRFLFIAMEMEREMLLQESNRLTLYLDIDDNDETGKSSHGLGAELEWRFGERSGFRYLGQGREPIAGESIGLVLAPSIMSRFFEIAIDLKLLSRLQDKPLGPNIKMALEIHTLGNLPQDTTGLIHYQFEKHPVDPKQTRLIEPKPETLRLVSFDIDLKETSDPKKHHALTRILRTVRPDVLSLQGCYGLNPEQVREILESILPSSGEGSWHIQKQSPGLMIASRFPIQASYLIATFDFGAARAFLIDTQNKWARSLLLISTHLACCDQESSDWQRQLVCDAVMAFVRDAKSAGGILDHAKQTPIVIAGNMNFTGSGDQLRTLRTGAIMDRERFGPGTSPDWDHSPFSLAEPQVTGLPMIFTWSNPSSSYTPARLDYILYSDSMLKIENQFVFYTPALDPGTRQTYGLNASDSLSAANHLPVVVDLSITTL